jgi:hypothetical protein
LRSCNSISDHAHRRVETNHLFPHTVSRRIESPTGQPAFNTHHNHGRRSISLSSQAAFAQEKPKYGSKVKENRAKFLAMPEIEKKQIIGKFFNLINDSGSIMSKNHFQGILT